VPDPVTVTVPVCEAVPEVVGVKLGVTGALGLRLAVLEAV